MRTMHILRPGTFTDMAGRKVTLDAGELRGIARRYRPGTAPLIAGHQPASGEPAGGWIADLRADERGLHARTEQVSDDLRAANRLGRYRFCSAKLRRGDAGWELEHVGMLGAAAPAVRGLDAVELAAGEAAEDVLVGEGVELAGLDENENDEARAARWLKGLFRRAATETTPAPSARQEDGMADDLRDRERALAADRRDLDAALRELEERATALASSEADRSRASAVEFAADLAKQGRILPRQQAGIALLLAALDGAGVEGEPMTVSLAAADGGEAKTEPAGTVLRTFLGELPEQVPYGELAPAGDGGGGPRTAAFAAPGGLPVDQERMKLHARALRIVAEKGVEYEAAVQTAEEAMHG